MQLNVTRVQGILNPRPERQPRPTGKLTIIFGFILVKLDSVTKIHKTHQFFKHKKTFIIGHLSIQWNVSIFHVSVTVFI